MKMKLRTRITAIAALIILLVTAISDGVIWMICRSVLMHEAEQTALRQMTELQSDLERQEMRYGLKTMSDPELSFFFKQRGDEYVICMCGDKILYNQTVLTETDLAEIKEHSVRYSEIAGRPVLIVYSEQAAGSNILGLCQITDLSPVMRRQRLLALGMLGVLLVVCIPAMIVLYLLMRRTMKPLGILSESAKQIAAGAYEERAAITDSDEIGLLAEDFNRMADAVQEKIAVLTDSEQRKTMFMADFSHELKTPLTAISGYAQTLRTVKLSEDEQEEALSYIYSESKRLDRLSKKMMRMMQLDRTESLQMTEIGCKELLDAVAETCRPLAEKLNIRLQIGQCSGIIHGDFDLLHDALCNLTENAFKASTAGQTVTLSAENGCITVQDEGCGIPQEEIKNLTEPFYMVDKSRSRSAGGAGLGLSIVKQIVRLHGAEMEIQSEPDIGTAVILHFVYTPLNT